MDDDAVAPGQVPHCAYLMKHSTLIGKGQLAPCRKNPINYNRPMRAESLLGFGDLNQNDEIAKLFLPKIILLDIIIDRLFRFHEASFAYPIDLFDPVCCERLFCRHSSSPQSTLTMPE
jgi:hypothetical protein